MEFKSFKLLKECYDIFTREKLRKIAKELNVKRGRNKEDTIKNLLNYKNINIWGAIDAARQIQNNNNITNS